MRTVREFEMRGLNKYWEILAYLQSSEITCSTPQRNIRIHLDNIYVNTAQANRELRVLLYVADARQQTRDLGQQLESESTIIVVVNQMYIL